MPWRGDKERIKAYNKAYHAARRAGVPSKQIVAMPEEQRRKCKMLSAAKHRAKLGGFAFNITTADINIPEFCPILGIRLKRAKGRSPQPNSPSLDRIKPTLGYVVGNVWVISHRANAMKQDATLAELECLVRVLKSVEQSGLYF